MEEPRPPFDRWLALGQGGFYAATGVWPIAHLASFERVTGPKTDDWLVQTVGALVAVIGVTLLLAGLRRRVTGEILFLAAAAAAALAAVDVLFVADGRISPIYLLDAVVEGGLIGGWIWIALVRRQRDREAHTRS